MRGITRTLGALFAASALASPAWAAADITGLTPWACYEFNNSPSNSGSGRRAWDNGGSISYTQGVSGRENTAASINKWTNLGNVSTTGGLTVSLLATEGTAHSTADRNGHLFSLGADGQKGVPQWWLRNTGTTGQLKLQGVFTEDLVITLPSGSTDATFHHYVIAISGDRTSVAVYVDGVAVDTTGKTVNRTASGTGVNANFYGYQVGARWGAGDASGCVVDDLRIYTATLTPGQVEVLYGKLYANTTAYTRTVSAATANWSETGAWTKGDTTADIPAVGSEATLTADTDTTLTLNGVAGLSKLTIGGTGTVTAAEGTKGLGAVTTVINTTTDLSGVSAGLGALTIATGKTLTVGDATITDIATGSTGSLMVEGNAIYSKTDMNNGKGIATGRVITVTGADAVLTLMNKDATGWNYNGEQKFVLTDGGTLKLGSRETLSTPVEMTKGHMVLTAAQSNRAIDFYNGNATVTDLTVKAKDGETGETLSTLTSTGSDETAQTALIRQNPGDSNNTFSIEVEDKARLRVDIILASSATYNDGNGNQTESGTAPLEKRGAGVLELTRENTYTTGTTITGGKVLLTGVGTVGTGSVTIASDATLELDTATNRDIANTISGSGTIVKRGAGVVELTAVSGAALKVSIQEGALGIGTLRPAALTIAEGATVLVTPTEDEVTAGSLSLPAGVTAEQILIPGYSISGVSEGTVSFGALRDVTWTPTANNQTWGDATLWTPDTVPTNGRLTINFSALTAPAKVTIPAGTYFESTTFVGGPADECALEIEVSSILALGTVSETSGNVTLPIDVVNEQSAVTVKNGTLTVKTSGDSTLTTALTGSDTNGAFAKSGDGVLTLNAAVRMANKTVVKAGTLKMGTEALTPTGGDDEAPHNVDVLAGATLDVNGKAGLWLNTVTLYEGATYANSGVEIGDGQRQLAGIALKGNAKVVGDNNFGLLANGFNDTTLTLNGYTLTKEGTGNFWLCNTTVTGGTTSALAVSAGQFSVKGNRTNLAADVTLSTTKDSGVALTKGGALTVNTGVTMTVAGRGSMLGGSGSLTVSDGATLKFTSEGDIREADVNYSSITGTGTIHFSGSGFRTLPNTAASRFTSTLAIKNDQADGLVITQGNTEANPTIVEVGSLSGAKSFRADWDPRVNNSRILRIVQSKNTDHTDNLLTSADRLAKVKVAGARTATDKTLTLSGSTTVAKLLEIEDTGSVNLTGSWAGAVTVSGQLAGTGTVTGTLTFKNGATLDVTNGNGALRAGTVTIAESDSVTVTLPGSAAAGTIILNCTNPRDIVENLTATSMPTGLKFAVNDAGTAVVLAAVPPVEIPTVPGESGSKVKLSEASKTILQAVATANKLDTVTEVSGSTTVNGTPTTLKAEAIDNALAVFGESVVTVDGTELKVDYNFGIVAVEMSLYGFTVKAKAERVAGDSTTAMKLASGATLKLVEADNDDNDDHDTVIGDMGPGFGYDTNTGLYVGYFSTEALIGKRFKVKATK